MAEDSFEMTIRTYVTEPSGCVIKLNSQAEACGYQAFHNYHTASLQEKGQGDELNKLLKK